MIKVLNIMLSRSLGGIQQSFLDYDRALTIEGFDVVNIISAFAQITRQIDSKKRSVLNLCSFDPISPLQIKNIIACEKPQVVVAHGNRSIKFCLGNDLPVIGVAHNYKTKWLKKCDYVIAITNHLREYLIGQGMDANRIMPLPNMIETRDIAREARPVAPVSTMGAMGRFVRKKGFDMFLVALSLLKAKCIELKAVIGGGGEEESRLKNLSSKLGLDNCVTFLGWVDDKAKFFDKIDIFCLPSLHEPFGIIALEAMLHHVPIVSTTSEGPSEIIEDGKTGLLCDMTAEDIALKLTRIIEDADLGYSLAVGGYKMLRNKYDINIIAKQLREIVEKIVK